ncbi:MAG: hypothetical protein AAF135_25575, partial [Bacteroidota bacterium]
MKLNHLILLIPLVAACIAYANCLSTEFIFDDWSASAGNEVIVHGEPWEWLWKTPDHTTVSGRPAAQWTFALNYFLFKENAQAYRAFNLIIHLGNTCLILLIFNHVLPLISSKRQRFAWIAIIPATLWSIHPLTTSAVTNLVQRAESQAVFLYLIAFLSSVYWLQERKTK